MLIAPSILSADFARLGEEIEAIGSAGADYIHIDVMDGQFVPNITIGPVVISSIRGYTKIPFDVHLMINSPEMYVKNFAQAGADIITVHAEATNHLHRLIQQIKDLNKMAGVSLNPATPISAIENILEDVDLVLIMSVNPGFGGQKFIENSLMKIKNLKKILLEKGLKTLIEVDGGVNDKNIRLISDAGCDIAVAGSYIFGSSDYSSRIKSLKCSIS